MHDIDRTTYEADFGEYESDEYEYGYEFEDEGDRKTTHCEFTATHGKSGKKFSVEAKFSC